MGSIAILRCARSSRSRLKSWSCSRPAACRVGESPRFRAQPDTLRRMANRHVVVVGAGAAGMTAAIRAAESGARVTLLNAHPRIGLKILMSGGTRCNVTHREVEARDFCGGSQPFVARILRAFTPAQTRDWFESLGVELKLEESGKYFPVTDDAQTVLGALLRALDHAGVEVRAGARVVRLERPGQAGAGGDSFARAGWRLGIQKIDSSAALGAEVSRVGESNWPLPNVNVSEWLEADAVILAAGGLSFPRTGSDGTGFALAASLGHTLVPTVPALSPLAAEDSLCRSAQGVTLPAELALWVSGKREFTTRGSLLIAHFGYSGPAALDLSRHWLRAGERVGEPRTGERATEASGGGGPSRRVTANFTPGESAESLTDAWTRDAVAEPKLSVRRWLARRVPDSLAMALATEAGVDPGRYMSQLDRSLRAALLTRLTARELPVTGTMGYERAEATAGGVALDEVDPSTLESRKAPSVYLCGEMLDVDGRLGGFNFQWAWSSGTVAGTQAARPR
ncbi:MAG: NAD(P)/FAD-dependent oxidoreductase [Candidatus Eiseniibacteriota bacterium]